MARPVVASLDSARGLAASAGRDFEVASGAQEFVEQTAALLADRRRSVSLGEAARRCVLARYGWDASLALLEQILDGNAAANASSETMYESVTGVPV